MKTVSVQVSRAQTDTNGAYRMDLTITSSNDITKYLFVKQRILLPDNTNDDRFVTVANPVQIEDIPQQVPDDGDVYFRDLSVSLVSADPNLLAETRDRILADLQLTISQAEQLDLLAADVTYNIDKTAITTA